MAVRTAEDVLRENGFAGDRLLKLAYRIANDELRRRGAFLDHERLEDLVAFLALHGVRASLRYDPDRPHAKYGSNGGGDHFASWMADILSHRVTDWYRSKAEGHGDKRYGNHDRIVLDGNMSYATPDDFDREIALRRMEDGSDMDEAEAELGQGLSDPARYGLKLARRAAEGYPVNGGKGSVQARAAVRRELLERGDVPAGL